MRYDIWFVLVAFICLLAGEAMGIWMGAAFDFTLSPVHAHINLLGWVTLALYGIMHHIYPALGKSKLAMIQFLAAIVSVPLMGLSLAFFLMGNQAALVPLSISEVVIVLATVLFLAMFWLHVARAKT